MKSLASYRTATLSLDQLCEAATELVPSADDSADARVQAVPDARTVRYYQTLGLLDRPVRYDGRQAVYGFRHLLQFVAVKRLQAQGLSLAQVQSALQGRTNAQLEAALSREDAAEVPTPPKSSTAVSPARVAGEVAPGVLVVIDPSIVQDPNAVLSRIRALLSPKGRP